MGVSQIGNTAIPSSLQQSSNKTLSNDALGKTDFLNLLVTQLRHQNPLEPMKQEEYAAELAQFSSLEQLSNLNDGFDQMYASNMQLNQSITNALSANLIGKNLRGTGNQVEYNAAGDNKIRYQLGSDAQKVELQIMDAQGNVLRKVSLGAQEAGKHTWNWDGGLDGSELATNGATYSYKVTATDANDESIMVNPLIEGKITGVEFGANGSMSFLVGGTRVSTGNVQSIYSDQAE